MWINYHTWILTGNAILGSPGCGVLFPSPQLLPKQRPPNQSTLGSPNFELVADILDWLLHRYEPGIAIPDDISISANFFRKKTLQGFFCLWFCLIPTSQRFFLFVWSVKGWNQVGEGTYQQKVCWQLQHSAHSNHVSVWWFCFHSRINKTVKHHRCITNKNNNIFIGRI